FPTPFAYDGTSNLMVDFSFNNSSYTTAGACAYTTASATRTIYYYTDSGYGDPLTWSGTTSPSPISSTSLPNIQLTFNDQPLAIRPEVTGNYVNGSWSGSVSVPFAASAVVLKVSDGLGHSGTS